MQILFRRLLVVALGWGLVCIYTSCESRKRKVMSAPKPDADAEDGGDAGGEGGAGEGSAGGAGSGYMGGTAGGQGGSMGGFAGGTAGGTAGGSAGGTAGGAAGGFAGGTAGGAAGGFAGGTVGGAAGAGAGGTAGGFGSDEGVGAAGGSIGSIDAGNGSQDPDTVAGAGGGAPDGSDSSGLIGGVDSDLDSGRNPATDDSSFGGNSKRRRSIGTDSTNDVDSRDTLGSFSNPGQSTPSFGSQQTTPSTTTPNANFPDNRSGQTTVPSLGTMNPSGRRQPQNSMSSTSIQDPSIINSMLGRDGLMESGIAMNRRIIDTRFANPRFVNPLLAASLRRASMLGTSVNPQLAAQQNRLMQMIVGTWRGDVDIPPAGYSIVDKRLGTRVAVAGISARRVTYTQDVKPIFDDVCVSCHQAGGEASDKPLDAYDNMLEGGRIAAYVLNVVERINRTGEGKMPPTGELSIQDKSIIRRWATQSPKFPR